MRSVELELADACIPVHVVNLDMGSSLSGWMCARLIPWRFQRMDWSRTEANQSRVTSYHRDIRFYFAADEEAGESDAEWVARVRTAHKPGCAI